MSDYFAGEITIGGTITRPVLEELKNLIIQEGYSLDYGEPWTEEQLEKAFTTEESVRICDHEARYGELEEIRDFLVENKIPFDAHNDARYEYDAENTYYRGQDTYGQSRYSFLSTQDGRDLIEYSSVESIVNDGELDEEQKVEEIRQLLEGKTPLPKLDIV